MQKIQLKLRPRLHLKFKACIAPKIQIKLKDKIVIITPIKHAIKKQYTDDIVLKIMEKYEYKDPISQTYIKKCVKKHGDRFDYSETVCSTCKDIIICMKHGKFNQRLSNHVISKDGCPICVGIGKVFDLKSFIDICNEKFNFKYDYSLAVYTDQCTNLKIICPLHGLFEQTPSHHRTNKTGCLLCSKTLISKSLEQFILDARKIHGYKYGYLKSTYVNGLMITIKKIQQVQ